MTQVQVTLTSDQILSLLEDSYNNTIEFEMTDRVGNTRTQSFALKYDNSNPFANIPLSISAKA